MIPIKLNLKKNLFHCATNLQAIFVSLSYALGSQSPSPKERMTVNVIII